MYILDSQLLLYFRFFLFLFWVGFKGTVPPPTWPSEGSVTFINTPLVYRPGLPSALRGVSFEVFGGQCCCPLNAVALKILFYAGERIGVVGRTGSRYGIHVW